MDLIKDRNEEHKILFLQSQNEWGESNYVEPDLKYGRKFLDVLRELLISKQKMGYKFIGMNFDKTLMDVLRGTEILVVIFVANNLPQ